MPRKRAASRSAPAEEEDAPYDPAADDDAPYDPAAEEEDAPYDPAAGDDDGEEEDAYDPGAEVDVPSGHAHAHTNQAGDDDSDDDIDFVVTGPGQAPPQALGRHPMMKTAPARPVVAGSSAVGGGNGEAAMDVEGRDPNGMQTAINMRTSAIISIAKPLDETEVASHSGTAPIFPQPSVSRPALPIPRTDGTGNPDAPEGIEQAPPPDLDQIGRYNGKDIFDVETDEILEKGWRRPGATLADYFNYGFDERSWRRYAARRRQMRSATN